jgi:hypothetical protein
MDEFERLFDRKLRAQRVDGPGARLPERIERWVEDESESPYLVLRASVFADEVVPTERPYRVEVAQPVKSPHSVCYSGPQLYRADLEVCLELWRLKRTAQGDVTVVTNWLLRALGRSASRANRDALEDTLESIARASFWIQSERSLYSASIVCSMLFDGDRLCLDVNRCIAKLFAPDFSWRAAASVF